jgi:chromosome partitioning protein
MRVDPRTNSAGELDEFLNAFEFPLVAHLRATQVYVHCARDGLTVFDLPRSRAEPDWEQWRPLTRWIARQASVKSS